MKRINVVKPFRLTFDDHTTRDFKPGVVEVDEKIADHWYVKAHSEPVTETPAAAEPAAAPPAAPAAPAAPAEPEAKPAKTK
jgi:hypothetical protein